MLNRSRKKPREKDTQQLARHILDTVGEDKRVRRGQKGQNGMASN
jgi:hypothetical protein